MTAYIIANVTVTDPEAYEEYRRFSTLAMRAHDVQVLVRGGKVQTLEGRDPDRTVILQFPNMAAATVFYNSVEYGRARHAREHAAIMTMYIVEGV
ncbi:DUF1330 domain-containing protein [Alcaligenaceae bacterium]|nr:DUF1330 domain-containing protein [Alcaligenaceae bacterium]